MTQSSNRGGNGQRDLKSGREGGLTRLGAAFGLALLLSFAILKAAEAQQPGEFEWILQFGGVGAPNDIVDAIASDAAGNVVVAGMTRGSLPGYSLVGPADAFVRMYHADGFELWTRQFEAPGDDRALGVATHAADIYVVGQTSLALPGQTSAGGLDAFVRKYDHLGNERWTRQFGTSANDIARAVFVDDSGVYVAGETAGVLPDQVSQGSDDVFVRKYDHDGNEVWTRQFGTEGADVARAIAGDATSLYVAGRHQGSGAFVRALSTFDGSESWDDEFGTGLDIAHAIVTHLSGIYVVGQVFEPLPGHESESGVGEGDAFIRKYDLGGNEGWTRVFGTLTSSGAPMIDAALAVSASQGGIYVAGTTRGALPGQTHLGIVDAFVRKYDPDGDEVWTRQFGTPADDAATGISADLLGVYVGGTTSGTLPGQTSAGGVDAFVRKYDLDGGELWTRQFGSEGSVVNDFAWDVHADGTGNV
jgi:hypothetical protein